MAIYGWSGSTASVHMLHLLLLSLSVGRQLVLVSDTVTAVSEPSVSAVVLVTAITELSATAKIRKTSFGWSLHESKQQMTE